MIDSIKKIGKERPEPFPKSLTKVWDYRKWEKKTRESLLMKLIFWLDEKKITSDFIALDDSRLRNYYWVGNAEGNRPQNRLTTNRMEYLTNSENKKRSTYNIIQDIKNFWQNEKIPGPIIKLKSELEKIEEKFFKDSRKAKKSREQAEKAESPHKEDIDLYTICIKENEKIEELAKTEGYEKFLEWVFLHPHKAVKGRCHVCGEKKKVLPDPTFRGGSILKVYVTDKKGFTSGIADTDEARFRTFSVCPDCLRELLAGENYIHANLRDQLGRGFGVYLIPKSVRFRKLDKMKECIRGAFGAVRGFEGLQEFERRLERDLKLSKSYEELKGENICLDLIFGYPARAKFDFKYNIQDVPLLRLETLRREMIKIAKRSSRLLGGSEREWNLGFQEIREIFPLRTQRGRIREWKVLLEFFSAMSTKTPYPKDLLIRRAIMLAKIHRFGVYELHGIRKPGNSDRRLVGDMLKWNLLLKLLQNIGCMSMKSEVNADEGIPTEANEWCDEIGYSQKQKALFLLGYLVGKVGSEQYKKGDEKKAILNRINFEGMRSERVIMLANRILKSLRDYRLLLPENEKVYASMKSMLDKTVKKMEDPAENLFNILSGYAFSTRLAIIKGGERKVHAEE